MGKFDEAIKAYDRVVELDPQYAYAWFAKGKALYYLENYEEAIQALDKVLELDPKVADAWNLKGLSLKALGFTILANEAFDKAIENNPNNADAWYNKGLVLESLGKSFEAEDAFAKAKGLQNTGPIMEISGAENADQGPDQLAKPRGKKLSGYMPRDYIVPLNPYAFTNDAEWAMKGSGNVGRPYYPSRK